MKKILFIFLLPFFGLSLNGQDCLTADGGIYYNNDYVGSYTGSKTTPILIKLYIWRTDAGSGFTPENLTQTVIEKLNEYYNDINIYFDICVDTYVGTPGLFAYTTNSYDDGVNLYLVHNWSGGLAEANGSLNCWADAGNVPAAHEVGHCLGLFHTFAGGTCPVNENSELAPTLNGTDYVDSPNCSTHGDLICDTPAEPSGAGGTHCYPYLSDCQFQNPNGQHLDFASNPYIDPFNVLARNIMGENKACRDQFTDGQNVRMRDMIAGAPILSNITREHQSGFVYSSEFTYLNNTIVADEVWDENTTFNYDVTVAEGVELTITADIKFTAGNGLHIERGGKLNMNGGTLDLDVIRKSCNPTGMLTWKGVSIATDDNVQSVVIMSDNSAINNADVALDIEGQGSIFFFINNCEFKNNRISILASNNTFVAPFIKNTKFKVEEGYLPTSEFGQVTLENCNRVLFSNCEFIKSSTSTLVGSAVTSFNTGITSINCDFIGWHRGVNMYSASDKTGYFTLGLFKGNNVGIWNGRFFNSLIKESDFKLHNTQYGDEHIGIIMSQTRGIRIFENDFEGVAGVEDKKGVFSANSPSNTLYNNNTFEDLDIAYDSENCGNALVGLVHECNVFKNNERDFNAEFGLKNHGSLNNAIGNMFSHNSSNSYVGSDFTVSDFGFSFEYFHDDGNAEETPMFVSGFNPTAIDEVSGCIYPSNIVNYPPSSGTLTPFTVKHHEFNDDIDDQNDHIDTHTDSGDTQGVLTTINTDSPTNPTAVYNQLLTLSPWVSIDGGQALINNSQYYTESQLVNLYVANPFWMQEGTLYNFVNGSSSPLSPISVNYINNNSSGIDAQSTAQFVLSDLAHGRDVNITNAINFINTVDDNGVNYSDLRTWFGYMDGPHGDIAIAETHMTEKNYGTAISYLTGVASSEKYLSSGNSDLLEYVNLLNVQINVYNDKRNEWNLTTQEYNTILNIANGSNALSANKAQGILSYYYGMSFPVTHTRRSSSSLYALQSEDCKKRLQVFPNPSNASFTIDNFSNFVGDILQIMSLDGQVIYKEVLKKDRIDHRNLNLKNGLYILQIHNENGIKSTGKVLIID